MEQKYYTKDLKERHSKKIFQKAGQYSWETPDELFNKLDKEFNFTLDPCCDRDNNKTDIYFTEKQNGLNQDWSKDRVFMNPPYGHTISKWIEKAYKESLKGALVVCLLPVRTDTKWWWNYCMKGEIRFIKGRVKFKGRNTKGELVNYPATFPSAIVIFKNDQALSKLNNKYISVEEHKKELRKMYDIKDDQLKSLKEQYEKEIEELKNTLKMANINIDCDGKEILRLTYKLSKTIEIEEVEKIIEKKIKQLTKRCDNYAFQKNNYSELMRTRIITAIDELNVIKQKLTKKIK